MLLFIWKVAADAVNKCGRCLMNKRSAGVMPMRTTSRSTYPWQVLHADIVSYGGLHLLTLIDQFSKVFMLESITYNDYGKYHICSTTVIQSSWTS